MKRSTFDAISESVAGGIHVAENKFPGFPMDPIHGASIVAEEAGELVKAVNEFTYEKGNELEMRREAYHVAVTAFRFIDSLKWTKARKSKQI